MWVLSVLKVWNGKYSTKNNLAVVLTGIKLVLRFSYDWVWGSDLLTGNDSMDITFIPM